MMASITRFLDFIDRRAVVRRIVLLITVWMTWRSFVWAAAFAQTTTFDGTNTGLVIAAVTAPVAALQGFIFKVYSEGRA